jgi:hypothetical protein
MKAATILFVICAGGAGCAGARQAENAKAPMTDVTGV